MLSLQLNTTTHLMRKIFAAVAICAVAVAFIGASAAHADKKQGKRRLTRLPDRKRRPHGNGPRRQQNRPVHLWLGW